MRLCVGVTKQPVLAVWGTADKTMSFVQSRLMQRDIPQVQLHPIEGGGHAIPLSHAGEITELMVDFLQD
jgi:pimeloyl-ACP methyl ester carboxylesterase